MAYGEGSRTKSWSDYEKRRKYERFGNTGQDIGVGLLRNFIGGPLGQIESAYGLASGKPTAGINDAIGLGFGDGTTFNDMMNEDVYNSLSPDEWTAFTKMPSHKQQEFISKRLLEISQRNPEIAAEDRAAAREAAKQKSQEDWRNETMTKLGAFADEMGMSVEQLMQRGDMGIKQVGATGANQAGQAAYAAGLGTGGVSALNTQRAYADAQQNYQLQRKQLGANALSNLGSMQQQQYMNDEDRRRYEQGMNMQMQQAEAQASQQAYQQQQQAAGGTLGMIGGAVGAYFGGAGGATAGYQLGSSLGQSNYTQNNPYNAYKYSYPRGTSQPGSGRTLGGKTYFGGQ